MARTAATLGFSVPPALKKEVESMARRAGMTKSEFFRDMVRTYKQLHAEQEFRAVQGRISRQVGRTSAYTEADIEKLVLEGR